MSRIRFIVVVEENTLCYKWPPANRQSNPPWPTSPSPFPPASSPSTKATYKSPTERRSNGSTTSRTEASRGADREGLPRHRHGLGRPKEPADPVLGSRVFGEIGRVRVAAEGAPIVSPSSLSILAFLSSKQNL